MADFFTDLVPQFQEFVAGLPEWLQPAGVALAGAVPFVEGEGAAVVGVLGGIPTPLVVVAAILGNVLAVTLVVLVSAGTRKAVVAAARRGDAPPAPPSARREKFDRAFARYGVAGVCLLGPLLIPTHFTAAALTASGVSRARVLAWQAVAITLWTTGFALVITGVIRFAG
ncbi:small multidrug efflux protein [Cellulomonas triticagri]|uniref:Small multidrug efflux protein n=1 Tax=Cellulomonas triticagri TaxID=2483352 RepID=A0A3M2JPZ9_9CELL|nr:small multidrug efflux protein [Cellulomonas triticagri]RMI14441.1 small multidrug efflux protein [Cellulomonas triticagri]